MTATTLPARSLGQLIRDYRKRAQLTANAASKLIETSPQTYARLEQGNPGVKVTDLWINALANGFGCSDQQRRELLTLAAETRASKHTAGDWWRSAAGVDEQFSHYLSLEQAANRITNWQTTLIPGLLQTADYRRQLIWAQDRNAEPDEIEQRLAVILRRQEQLHSAGTDFEFLISEVALLRQVGSIAVMREQIQQLRQVAARGDQQLRIVRLDADPLGDLVRPFAYLQFPILDESGFRYKPLIFVEGWTGSLFLESPEAVGRYEAALDRLRAIACGQEQSVKILEKAEERF